MSRVLAGVMPMTLAVQACSFASAIALARLLGATVGTDAYFLGLSVPASTSAILWAALRLGAIPALMERRREAEDDDVDFAASASALLTAVVIASTAVSVVATAVTVALLPLALGGEAARLVHLTQLSVLALSPLGVLGAIVGVLSAILAARGRFLAGVTVMAFEPLLKLLSVIALGGALGAGALVLGSVVGSFLAAVALWAVAWRDGIALTCVRHPATPLVRQVVRLSVPLVVSQSVLQVNLVLDRVMASPLGSGSVTELELGARLFAVPATLATATLIAPLTASWASRLADHGWPALEDSLSRAMRIAALFLPPVVTLAFVLRNEVIRLIFAGGAYSERALAHTSEVFGMLALGLPAMVFVVFFATLFVVARDSIVPMKIAIANVALNAGLNVVLRAPLGVSGIALSTTLTMSILVFVYAVVAHRRWRPFRMPQARRIIVGSCLSILAIAAAAQLLHPIVEFNSTRAAAVTAIVSIGSVGLALHALVVVALGVTSSGALLRRLPHPELRGHA